MSFETRKRVVEAVVLSTITFCLAVWGWRLDWRRTVQKAMNSALRMLTGGTRYSRIEDMLRTADWANLDNLWKLEQVMALRRLCETRNSDLLFGFLTRRTNQRYEIRQDGYRLDWTPRSGHGLNAFLWTAVKEANLLRVPQRAWYNTLEGRKMTSSEIRLEIKHDLIKMYGNTNI